jgi:hypothetical protein
MPIPWKYVESWNCIACGICCKEYQVVLGFNEWVNLIRTYGVGVTQPGITSFYLEKKSDGTCVFLHNFFDKQLCLLQGMKPKACKIWPFKILATPKFGKSNEAVYKYRDRNFFVYVDPACIGTRWGKPTQEFMHRILPELIEIALGLREKQYYSTSRITYRPQYFKVEGRKIV